MIALIDINNFYVSCERLFNPTLINQPCLLYTSDAADEEDSVDLGGRRIIKKTKKKRTLYNNDKKHTDEER